MSYLDKLKNNVIKNYVFILLRNFNLTNGLWMIYLASKGMSLLQLGLLEGIYHISSLFMEVPTGMIADIYGRKASRVLGRFIAVIGCLLMVMTNDFYMFALSFFLSALANNLESGAGDALVYDSLKELGMEKQYMKVNGKNEMLFQGGSILALPLAGYFADKNFDMVFYASAVIALLTAIFSLSFVEPAIGRVTRDRKNPFSLLCRQLKESIAVLKKNKRIALLIIIVEVFLTLVTTMFYYLQNHWSVMGYSKFKITVIFCVGAGAAALTALVAYKIERVLKQKRLLIIMPAIIAVCIWGIALTAYSPAFYVIMNVVESILFVVTMDYINKVIPSENRATILSMSSMLFSFYMIILFPIIGRVGDIASLTTAFIGVAALATMLTLGNSILLFNTRPD
ncbi:MAG: MFS transporter [Bacillota bacterium]